MKPRALISWSTGKDSAFAFHEARRELEIVGAITSVTEAFGRVSIHGVREVLLERQLASVGLPLHAVAIPSPCPNEVYERALFAVLASARDAGVTHIVFGDLFLADIRSYREQLLAKLGLVCVFPLWRRDTSALAREMIAAGLRALLTSVDLSKLDTSFAGRAFDAALLAALPANVDPCGEHGEFHTFVTDGPMFREAIAVRTGDVVVRDGYAYGDLLPS
jgi:uncharacterized protein (TIGR00290 family)